MALVATQGLWMPPKALLTIPTAQIASSIIDATGEKLTFTGRVWNKDRATKSITKLGFRFGNVTKAGGSALTASLQNVDLATGPPYQPDGTQDQTVAIANANASFVSGTWIQTDALSATRSVAFGELLGIVIEYDGGGRLGADSVAISYGLGGTSETNLDGGIALFTAAWAAVAGPSNIIFEFDDGTFGTLVGAFPCSALSSIAYNSGSAADEVALQFTVPFLCRIDGAFVLVAAVASADFDLVLYEGTTVKATVSVDANAVAVNASGRFLEVAFPEVTLVPGTVYYLAIKPTTANNVTVQFFEVAAAGHFQAHAGDTSWKYNTRVNGGAWGTAVNTRRPLAGIRISALDDGSLARAGLHAIEHGIAA